MSKPVLNHWDNNGAILMGQNGAQKVGVADGHAVGWRIAAEAMGIDWMKREELTQAIPPVMTHYIGTRLMEVLA